MRKRAVRVTLVTFLLVATLAAAFILWEIQRRTVALSASEDGLAERVDSLTTTIGEIGTAQHGYVAAGQLDEPWFERTSMLLAQLNRELSAIRLLLRSQDAARTFDSLAEYRKALAAADDRIRENLIHGQELMAADVIFSDGRNNLDALVKGLREIRSIERSRTHIERAELERERWIVLGSATLAWLVVMAMLIPVPATGTGEAPRSGTGEILGTITPPVPSDTNGNTGKAVDFAATAALCTDLSRVAETAALSELLGRAAAILDSSAATLWLGAGEQLFAVLGHGYSQQTLARFGPIARDADNAAAKAWRSGRLTTVAGSGPAAGAIVTPMFGPGGCIGVLAFESRSTREHDPTVQAAATLIAAQVATAVSAWPEASSPQGTAARPA
jgi:GAF domain-containing protein